LQGALVLVEQRLALAHAQGGQRAIEVLPDRTAEFRLAAVGLDHAHIRGDTRECAVEQGGLNTGFQGFSAKGGAPLFEALFRLDIAGNRGWQRAGGRRGLGDRREANGVGGGRFLGAGDEQDKACGGGQSAQVPTVGKAKKHAWVQVMQIRSRPYHAWGQRS
jgi:hypothetical protein